MVRLVVIHIKSLLFPRVLQEYDDNTVCVLISLRATRGAMFEACNVLINEVIGQLSIISEMIC